jgi:hypothetical protein
VSLTLDPLQARLLPSTTPLIASSYFDSAVYEFSPKTGAVTQTLVAPYSQSTLNGPAGMTLGPDGNLYFASQLNNSIVQYNFSTQTLSTFISSSVLQSIATSQGDSEFFPAGLTFGPDHNLYVSLNGGQSATSGGAVIRFNIGTSGGKNLVYTGTNSTVATGLVQPTDLTFGLGAQLRTLYVSNSAADDVIQIAHATGTTTTSSVFIAAGTGGLDYPSGLTWGPDGNLYVVDLGATNGVGQVLQFSATGSFLKVYAQPASSLAFEFPSAAIFLPNGNLLTADLGPANPPNLEGSIAQYDSTGNFLKTLVSSSQFTSTGQGTSGISPSQLLLDVPKSSSLSPLAVRAVPAGIVDNQAISTLGGSGSAILTVSHIQPAIPGPIISGNGTSIISTTGTPRTAGTWTFEVKATDSDGDQMVDPLLHLG